MIINQLHIKIGMTKSILQMAPTPNFGVILDFVHPFLTGVDFRTGLFVCKLRVFYEWNVLDP